MAKTGYINGSDLLLLVGDKAVGSATSYSLSFQTESKDRAVKPLLSAGITSGLWKGKGVVGLSYSVNFDGLRFYNESEFGFKNLVATWKAGKSVTIKLCERNETSGGQIVAWLEGKAVLTSLSENAPAQDDATYSGTFENDGEPTTLDETKLTGGTTAAASGSGN